MSESASASRSTATTRAPRLAKEPRMASVAGCEIEHAAPPATSGAKRATQREGSLVAA
jgi:hypothetical protein